jgi:hypothetical protein
VNTVEPRIDQMQRRSAEREFGGTIAEPQLDAITKELRLTTAQTETLTELNRSGYLSKEGPWDIPIRLTVPPNERLGWYLGKISNVPSSEQWIGAVRDVSGCGAELFKLAAIDVSKIGTHLRRIRKEDAIGLLARGYLHAFLSTVELRPLEAKEVKQLEKVPQRLRNIAK